MESKNYKECLSVMRSLMIAKQKKVTDFNEGSIIMTIFEAVSRIVESAYIDTRLGYNNMLKQIAYSIFGFKPKTGTMSSVQVKFVRNIEKETTTVIPKGTRVSDGTHIFETTENAKVNSNELESNLVFATATEKGFDYNVNQKSITIIESAVPSDIVEVVNPNKAEGGTDEETESETLARFKDFINGLQGTSKYGLKAGLLAMPEVRSIGITEHPTPKQNIYNFTVYVDDGTGHMSESLKEKIKSRIDGDGTEFNPGLRTCGVNCDILAADIVTVNIEVTCTIYRTENNVATAEIEKLLKDFINSLKIGDDVIQTDLIIRLRQIAYIKDVSNLKINGLLQNLSIIDSQIARIGEITILLRNI